MTLSKPAGSPARVASSAAARALMGEALAGFTTAEQPAASAGTNLAGDHGLGEVPRCDGCDHADRLLQHQQALGGVVGGNDLAPGPFALLGEPVDEVGRIHDLTAWTR